MRGLQLIQGPPLETFSPEAGPCRTSPHGGGVHEGDVPFQGDVPFAEDVPFRNGDEKGGSLRVEFRGELCVYANHGVNPLCVSNRGRSFHAVCLSRGDLHVCTTSGVYS